MEIMKRDYSQEQRRQAAAAGEAMPDGSYPIKNTTDLMNAIRSWGRGGARADVKAHIMRRARALNAEDMIPDNWKKPGMKKDTWAGSIIPQKYTR